MDKTSLSVYLFFGGDCRAAMEFYKGIFGGELAVQTRGEVDDKAPAEMKDLVIHASLTGGTIDLMGSDWTEVDNKPQKRVSLSLVGSDEPALRKTYDQLAAGGNADHPLKKEFWGDTFGGLTDRYGISWLVNISAKKQEG